MKTVVIAGGTSFIGLHLIHKLQKEGYNIVSIVHKGSTKIQYIKKISTEIPCIELDLSDYSKMGNYISLCDYYIPLTWDGTKKEDRNNQEKNRNSYLQILESIKSICNKTNCKKILLPGTFSEYGECHELIKEDMNCDPFLEYGKYKLKLYHDVREYCIYNQIKFVEARLFSVYGIGDSDEKMINSIIQKMLAGQTVELTECKQIWDFLHVEDVADAFIKLMDHDVENGIYNVTTNLHRTLKSYIDEIYEITKSNCHLEYGKVKYINDIVPHVISDNRKIKSAVLWNPQIDFSDGIYKVIEYYRNYRKG